MLLLELCVSFFIVSGFIFTLDSIALGFGSISILGSDALYFWLTLLFVSDDNLGGGGGTLSFGNIGGIVIFNKVAILINVLFVSSPYVRVGIFNCGDLMMSRRSTAACKGMHQE